MRHIVVDIETLGIKPGCVILEIGAASFVHGQTDDITDTFSVSIDKELSARLPARITVETRSWWIENFPIVYGEVLKDCKKNSLPPKEALEKFNAWIFDSSKDQDIWFWGNGPEFDMSILGYYYDQVKVVENPFNFRRVASIRSLGALLPGVSLGSGIKNERPHRSVHDAVYEARVLQRFINEHIR